MYFIYEMKNDKKVLGIFKINLFNYSYFNKVIFTNEERYIKLLDVGSIFNNLIICFCFGIIHKMIFLFYL